MLRIQIDLQSVRMNAIKKSNSLFNLKLQTTKSNRFTGNRWKHNIKSINMCVYLYTCDMDGLDWVELDSAAWHACQNTWKQIGEENIKWFSVLKWMYTLSEHHAS